MRGIFMTRVLPPALKDFFAARVAYAGQSPTELLLLAARACLGVKEEGGDNCGPVVELFQSVVSKPCGQSWCLDFLQACIAYVEAATGLESALPGTQLVVDLWNQSKAYHAVSPPRPGDLILWRFGQSIHGHTGLIVGQDSLRYHTIEGNTSDSVGIDREGDGVYPKSRAKGGSASFVEMGFLRPFP